MLNKSIYMFKKRENVAEIEEGNLLSPKFDNDGLIPVVTTCYKTKEVLEVLDNEPIVNLKQLELWAWISRYYMTTLGEVMIAGLPNSLKLNSESMYLPSLNKYSDKELSVLKPSEQKIVDAL